MVEEEQVVNKTLWVLPKFQRDGFSPKETLHGLRQRFFVKPYSVEQKILHIDGKTDILVTNKCSAVLKLYKFYINHTQM